MNEDDERGLEYFGYFEYLSLLLYLSRRLSAISSVLVNYRHAEVRTLKYLYQ